MSSKPQPDPPFKCVAFTISLSRNKRTFLTIHSLTHLSLSISGTLEVVFICPTVSNRDLSSFTYHGVRIHDRETLSPFRTENNLSPPEVISWTTLTLIGRTVEKRKGFGEMTSRELRPSSTARRRRRHREVALFTLLSPQSFPF